MTDLLSAPHRAPGQARPGGRHRRPLAVDAALAALSAAGLPLVALELVVLLAWATDARTAASARAAARVAASAFLLAHRVRLEVPGGALGVPLLGLALAPALLLARTGRVLARARGVRGLRGAAGLAAATGAAYAGVLGLVALLAGGSTVRPSVLGALLAGAVTGTGATAAGVLTGPARTAVAARLPQPARWVLAGALAGAVAVLGAGALLAGAALASHAASADALTRLLGPGPVGGVALFLLELALVPTAALYAAAVLAGPGFVVGQGTAVSVVAAHLGAQPALPLLAALPPDGPMPLPVRLLPLVVVLAGGVAGLVVVRRSTGRLGWLAAAGWAAAAAGGAAGLLSLGWALGDGAAGPARMALVGASVVRAGPAALGELTVGATAAAAALSWWRSRRG